MALAERAELIARLSLEDKFSGKVRTALGNLKGMEGSLGRISGHASRGLKNAATNLAKIGAVAGGFVAINVKAGISSLAELEDATTSVDGAIQQLGLTGKVTSAQIAGWANEIERNTQAAFDDKAITAATTQLIRYGKVTADNLRPAMEVMTDLAARTGDVGSASTLLAKALADPEKAAGKLARQGIILTAQQQKQIKKMVEAGDAAGAQAKLLDILAESTKGAAAASKGPYNDAINILTDSIEDAQRVLGEGFLPVISKVADKLQDAVADEGFMREVREFGQNMAGAFDKAVEFAGNVPWGLIGQSLKTAGQGAKAIFDAFTMLPPWVQQAVITGWGLNKLTGGALGSIVGELGKGLIKGVLGMNAGVVNINAGVVNGGGVPGGAVAGAAKGGLGLASKVFLVGEAIGLGLLVKEVADGQAAGAKAMADEIHATLTDSLAGPQTMTQLQQKLAGIDQGLDRLPSDPIGRAIFQSSIDELIKMRTETVAAIDALKTGGKRNASGSPDDRDVSPAKRTLTGSVFTAEQTKANVKWDKIRAATDKSNSRLSALEARIREARAAQITSSERSRSAIVSAERSGTSAIVAAINRIQRPIVSVSVTGNTVRTVYRTGGTITRNVQPGILALT